MVTLAQLAEITGITSKGIEWAIKVLKNERRLRRVGPDKGGRWDVLTPPGAPAAAGAGKRLGEKLGEKVGEKVRESQRRVTQKVAGQVTAQVTAQVTTQVATQVTAQVATVLAGAKQSASASELQRAAGLSNRMHFLRAFLQPLLARGWLERTLPDKPRSRLQRYRTTAAGLKVLADASR